jgi:hypothetical protein
MPDRVMAALYGNGRTGVNTRRRFLCTPPYAYIRNPETPHSRAPIGPGARKRNTHIVGYYAPRNRVV